jgi:Flp pilus assembly protein TadD
MKRREAGVSTETVLPAAAFRKKRASGYSRKDEALTHRSQKNGSLSTASRTSSRVRSRAALFLVPVALLVAACLIFTGREPDTRQLTGEALALTSCGRFDEALPIQERIAALDPDDAQIRVELGFNYLSHQNNPARAVAVFKQAVDLEPCAKYMTFLAQAYVGSGDSVSAESTLRRAMEADRSYGYSYLVLVSLLEKHGRTTEAADLRRAAESAGVALSVGKGS